ncbi:hypothetical protein LCGC14_1973370 [marine sediment metagenome]|uniref:Uncharacterized protein n=1 Tax=marine sediment metagenome TaxID=412755 RepID=A0A0F9FB03_9ZZZZ
MKKRGHSYVANFEVTFDTQEQAEEFIAQGTSIGKRCEIDLEDPELVAMFDESGVSAEVDFVGGIFVDSVGTIDEELKKEIDAAAACGAEFTLSLRWVKDS